jgi:hypothetical protein
MQAGRIALLLVCAAASYAQEITGTISGEIRDSSGAVIPGVRVTVLNTGTNVAKTVTTGPSGSYRVPFLFFGTYRVTGEMTGFKTVRVDNIQLSTSEEARVDLTMSVGEVSETIEVSASDVILKTEEASVSTTIVQKQLENLPLVGRQIIAATLLAPGAYFVNNNSKAQRDSGFVRRNGVSLSVNGLTDISNKFYYDGIEGMNFDGGTRAFDPALEAVQRLRLSAERQAERVPDGRQEPPCAADRKQPARHVHQACGEAQRVRRGRRGADFARPRLLFREF